MSILVFPFLKDELFFAVFKNIPFIGIRKFYKKKIDKS